MIVAIGTVYFAQNRFSWAGSDRAPVAQDGTERAQLAQADADEERPDLDVPYVPTPEPVVNKMLQMVKVNKNDMVYDLGCGDGRMVVTAAKRYGARGLGVDIDPQRIRESRANAKAAGVTDKVTFLQKDLFTMDISPASVMAMYLLPSVNLKLRPQMYRQLKPGTRIVSHDFDMGNWQPDQVAIVKGPDRQHTLYHWVIPANAAGEWTLQLPKSAGGQKRTIHLQQEFQQVSGTMRVGNRSVPIRDAKMNGTRISFTVPAGAANQKPIHLSGQVSGGTMMGNLMAQNGKPTQQTWTARRTRAGTIQMPSSGESSY
ncbi:MAG: methyltransferase domain-containing protein [Armatimonadetes bacterium]|nr:methyltransferase domain-containing protein [Armatimonadota bacterium]